MLKGNSLNNLYLLDTCIYGVLVDKKHEEYENVKAILDYAKKHREEFVTTFIVYYEIAKMKLERKDMVLLNYYLTISKTIPSLEAILSDQYTDVKKLSWKYIQKLKIKSAKEILPDVLNYALASYAGIDTFVTLNRKDILGKELQPAIKRINEEMRVKYIEIKTPMQFSDSLI